MPLPAVSERAARTVAAELERLDQAITGHIVDGDRLPTVDQVMAPIVVAVERSVTAAIREITSPTTRLVADATATVVTPLRDMVTVALRDAARARRRVRTGRVRPVEERDSRETVVAWVRRVGAATAATVLINGLPKRERTPAKVRDVLRTVKVKPPPPTAAYGRMVVRTQTAIARADVSADVVDEANRTSTRRWAVLIRDGRNGPTDHECERVNNRWATALWLRNHRVEHPNCTRIGLPRELPAGARVTLLR